MRGILNTVPTGLLVVAVVCLSFGGVVLAVWLIRRYVPTTNARSRPKNAASTPSIAATISELNSSRVAGT